VYEIKVLGAGRVFGQFADPAGGLVNLFVFVAAEYDRFVREGTSPSLSSAGDTSGSFSVLAHGDGFQVSEQSVRVSYRVAGIQPEFLGIGVPFVAAGIVGVGLGLRARARRNVSSVQAAEPPC
jgi:hypothetical protein